MPATNPAKKFTARNLPALTAIASELGLHVHKCDSKTFDITPHAEGDDRRSPLDDTQRAALESFYKSADERFTATYPDFFMTDRGSWIRVTWRRNTRTQSQIDNVD